MEIVSADFDDRLHRLTGGCDVEVINGNEARLLHFELLPLDELRSRAKARLAAERWRREVGGIVVNGHAADSSREARTILDQAVRAGHTGVWKWRDGSFSHVTPDELGAVIVAVTAHVAACFAAEAAQAAAIDACDDPAALAIWDVADPAWWPG